MDKGTSIVGFVLAFLAGMGVMWGLDHKDGGISKDGSSAEGTQGGSKWSDSESPIPVTDKDPTWGSRTAPVTMVVFSDFQCPFCSKVEVTVDQMKAQYGKDKLRIVWKNRPLSFHDKAKPAAIAAEAVFRAKGSDAFWKFHDAAFKNQRELGDESYAKWAAEAGVDKATFDKLKADPSVKAKVDEDDKLAEKVGAGGTPNFFINGVNLVGAQPPEKFKEAIDKELEKANAKKAAGVKAEKLYVEMTKENFKAAPQPEAAKKDAPPAKPEEDPNLVWKVPVGSSPVDGPKDAPVTIVIFSDYQCPFCKKVEDTFTKIRAEYKDKVRFVWKDQPLPFHPRAVPSAILAREARAQKGDKAFWAAHHKLFELAPKLEDADLEGAAKDLGLDVAKYKEAVAKGKYKDIIEGDQELAKAVNAGGTPHMFVNGVRLSGAQPFEAFKTKIDAALAKTDALKAKGIAADKMYDEIMKEGKEPPPPPPPEKKKAPTLNADNAWKGGKSAKVVIQEFSDFECPFCSKVEPTLNEILKTYGDKVKIVWHHKPLPFHKAAPLASEAAHEALKQKGMDGFWKFHDKLFEKQREPGGLERPSLEKIAEEVGLDMAKFKKALDDRTHQKFVEADSKVGDDIGINGTPAFLINDYFLSGAQPPAEFKKLIERALKEAK